MNSLPRDWHGRYTSNDDLLGLDLDDVLEGADVVPSPVVADRTSCIVTLPLYSETERAAVAAQWEMECRESREHAMLEIAKEHALAVAEHREEPMTRYGLQRRMDAVRGTP